jgi:fumarate reductase flavoprotein subunit
MLRTFEADMNERGGQLHRGYAVTHLIESGDQVVGLEGQMHSGEFFQVKANSVVIADGGFQANPDLIKGPITQSPDRVFQRNAKTGMGEGMRMAQKVGANLSDLRGFYGHVLSKDAFTNDKLWPYGWLDFVLAAGIVVGKKGDRLFDEGLGGVEAANAIAALSDPLDAIVIADENIWNDAGTFNILPPNPRMVDAGGTLIKANSIEELALLAGIDPINLATIISNYNQAIQINQTNNLLPTRSVEKFKAVPIQKAPFYAIPVCAGITYTMGGICIDADARVLNDQELPIQGLYAVGCASGGLEGGVKKGYVGGLVKSSVTGLRAAEHILGQASVL